MDLDLTKIANLGHKSVAAKAEDLADLSFQSYAPQPGDLSIWMMKLSRKKPVFPWWDYQLSYVDDVERLNKDWAVANPQNLFDMIFLSQITRMAGSDLYVIFPGNIKTTSWGRLQDEERNTFLRGDECLYHLEGELEKKLTINWVPFYQPQRVVAHPSFISLWRLYLSKIDELDSSNCISFFSLPDRKNLPAVLELLKTKDDNRSMKMAKLVDWYGMFTSPLKDDFQTCATIYTNRRRIVAKLARLEKNMKKIYDQAKVDMLQTTTPKTAFKIITRHMAI